MSNFLKVGVIKDGALTALARMLTLAPSVSRFGNGEFKGALNDTLTLRIPAYTTASTRTLRTVGARDRNGLFEIAVPVKLTHNLYRDVPLSDEHQTLDIINFSRQVINPMLESIARGIEDNLVDNGFHMPGTMTVPDYSYQVEWNESAPYGSVVAARGKLNKGNVPLSERFLAVGSDLEASLLTSPQFARADQSGTTSTLREGEIGRIAGFTVLTSPGLEPDEGYAYHKTAYALALQAPIVPAGAPAGFSASQDGFAIRVVQVLDSSTIQNVVTADVFVGSAPTIDVGHFDEETGVFTPAESADESGADDYFVRAVKLGPDISE